MNLEELKIALESVNQQIAAIMPYLNAPAQTQTAAMDYAKLEQTITAAILAARVQEETLNVVSVTPTSDGRSVEVNYEVKPPFTTPIAPHPSSVFRHPHSGDEDTKPEIEAPVAKAPRKRRTKEEMEAVRMAEAKIKHAEEFAPAPVNSGLPSGFPTTPLAAPVEPVLSGDVVPSLEELKTICREFHAKHGNDANGDPIVMNIMDKLGITQFEDMSDSQRANLHQAILNYGK